MKILKISIVILSVALGVSQKGFARPSADHFSIIQHDTAYEQALRFEASADKAITPAKVLRWILGLRGHAVLSAPSPTEFQPIVNVNNDNVRIIAAIAYKF